MINIYPKNSSAQNLANEYNQEIYDYLTKKPGERYPKWLEEEIDKNKDNWKSTLERKKNNLSKK